MPSPLAGGGTHRGHIRETTRRLARRGHGLGGATTPTGSEGKGGGRTQEKDRHNGIQTQEEEWLPPDLGGGGGAATGGVQRPLPHRIWTTLGGNVGEWRARGGKRVSAGARKAANCRMGSNRASLRATQI